MKKLLLILFSCVYGICLGQSAYLNEDSLLSKIKSLQCSGDHFYNDGLFRSERFMGHRRNVYEDNNVFFNALIAFTLQEIRPLIDPKNQQVVDSIILCAKRNFPRYRNRNGDITYNFWQTHPDQPFPNHRRLSGMERFRLPDDFDDTSIIFLLSEKNDSLDKLLKNKMEGFTNGNKSTCRGTFRKYRKSSSYTTWFGEKMKPEIDICVLANTLLFVFDRGLEINHFDSATMDLISRMILEEEHVKHPHIISPQYQNTSIILYNVARLLAASDTNYFAPIRQKIITDIQKQLPETDQMMEQILLLSSLYRLGIKPDTEPDFSSDETEFMNFSFFVANPFSGKPLWVKRLIGKSKFLQYRYRCDAYNWVLMLEYVELRGGH